MTREQMNRLQDQITKLQADMYYRSGETLRRNLVPINGLITDSATTIHLSVGTGKSMKNVSTVTVTTMTGSILGDMGYVNNFSSTSSWLVSGFTATATIIDEHTIRLTLTSTATMANVTNNRPVSYYPSNATVGGLVLTFGG